MPVTVECSWCGSEKKLTPSKAAQSDRHFCDPECYTKWQTGRPRPEIGNGVEVECAHCGSETNVTPSRAARAERNFCDKECYTEWQTDRPHPEMRNRVEVECAACGAILQRIAAKAKEYDRFFCDKSCGGDWRSRNYKGDGHPRWSTRTVECSACGKSIERTAFQLEKYDRHFCDNACKAIWARSRRGTDAAAWKGGYEPYYGEVWPEEREAAIQRDNEQCFFCGLSRQANRAVYGRDFDVHHVIPRTKGGGNGLGNLVTLCRRCHWGME